MRLIETKPGNQPKNLTLSCLAFLLFCGAVSAGKIHAQDIPNTEEIKTVAVATPRKKTINPVKPKEPKPKFTNVSLKNNAPVNTGRIKPKSAGKEKVSESYAVVPAGKNSSKTPDGISGVVRLKQLNQAAAGVLIEAIRADTREMIGSAETNAAGEYRFSQLPSGIALVFLVSSPKTKPLIFQTAVENGMKNLDFTILPR